MATRTEFHRELQTLCPNVYYQPPPNIKLVYPCIIYYDGKPWVKKADNQLYLAQRSYEVMYITRQPIGETSDWFAFLKRFPTASFDRHFCVDNLHHYNYKVYY